MKQQIFGDAVVVSASTFNKTNGLLPSTALGALPIADLEKAQPLLEKYKAKFEFDERAKSRFVIIPHNSPKTPDHYNRIGQANPDLLLVDYDLSMPDENGQVMGISGVTQVITQPRPQDGQTASFWPCWSGIFSLHLAQRMRW